MKRNIKLTRDEIQFLYDLLEKEIGVMETLCYCTDFKKEFRTTAAKFSDYLTQNNQ